MNFYLEAMAAQIDSDQTPYAWIITKDHLLRPGDGPDMDATGTIGPRSAPDELILRLKAGEGDTFRMYDDDGILYYTGRGLCDTTGWPEEACYGPLGDFGMPNAGAVRIDWLNHPERNCG